MLWVLWLTYGTFYFCRSNLSAAVPLLQHDLAFTKTQIGWLLGSMKFTYGIGAMINGQLAERFSARRLLAIGMLGSAALNVVFGLGTGFYFLLFVWATNGYFQALGWTSTMRTAGRWFQPALRGRAIGIIGTGYQLTVALTFVVAGWSASWFGWRGAVFVPAAILTVSAVHMLATLQDAPPHTAAPAAIDPHASTTWLHNIGATLGNPRLWSLALALGLVNACRFGFLDWGITHLVEVTSSSIGASVLKYSVLPLGGIVGTLVSGWATDRFFGGRRIPMLVGMLLVLSVTVIGYDAIVRTNLVLSIASLALIGALIFGPQVLLVGTTPVDLARPGTTAAACGFVDCIGYLGAFTGDQVTGHLVDRYDWHTALWFWALCAAGAALVVAPLWRTRAQRNDA
jgi:sugar phosphate permease